MPARKRVPDAHGLEGDDRRSACGTQSIIPADSAGGSAYPVSGCRRTFAGRAAEQEAPLPRPHRDHAGITEAGGSRLRTFGATARQGRLPPSHLRCYGAARAGSRPAVRLDPVAPRPSGIILCLCRSHCRCSSVSSSAWPRASASRCRRIPGCARFPPRRAGRHDLHQRDPDDRHPARRVEPDAGRRLDARRDEGRPARARALALFLIARSLGGRLRASLSACRCSPAERSTRPVAASLRRHASAAALARAGRATAEPLAVARRAGAGQPLQGGIRRRDAAADRLFDRLRPGVTRVQSRVRRSSMRGVLQAVSDAMLVVVGWVLKAAPIGVCALAIGLGAQDGRGCGRRARRTTCSSCR